MKLKIGVQGIESSVRIVPDRIFHIKAGEMKKFPVYISMEGLERKAMTKEMDIIIESLKKEDIKITKKANFIIPMLEK